jgi:predicted trehalose synthase
MEFVRLLAEHIGAAIATCLIAALTGGLATAVGLIWRKKLDRTEFTHMERIVEELAGKNFKLGERISEVDAESKARDNEVRSHGEAKLRDWSDRVDDHLRQQDTKIAEFKADQLRMHGENQSALRELGRDVKAILGRRISRNGGSDEQ